MSKTTNTTTAAIIPRVFFLTGGAPAPSGGVVGDDGCAGGVAAGWFVFGTTGVAGVGFDDDAF